MRQPFTFKSMLLALLVMICCTVKAETVWYTDNDFAYYINMEIQEATLSGYSGNAENVVVPNYVIYEGKEYKVTSLGYHCFRSCRSLVSIEIPSSVTSLGDYCFAFCSSLASIEIPSSVTSLRWGCFYDCSSLTSINIPSSVTSIGNECFRDCSSLASVEIPSSVTSIGGLCFSGCSSLETIVVDANNPRYDSRGGCNAIIATASNTMIAGCKNTFIPSSVTKLGNRCFYGCSSLASIEIPSSVTRLGEQCFQGCSSLQTVICRMENVESDGFFDETPIENATLYVPELLLSTYQTTSPWSSFGTILPLTEEIELGIGNVSSPAVALRSAHGSVVLSGLADGTPVSYYSVDGRLLGKTSVDNGSASFSARPNSIVTVKVGKQSFKVRVK